MINANIALNIPDEDSEHIQSVEQLGELLEALGIVQPMFHPDGSNAADEVPSMLAAGLEIDNEDRDISQLAADYSELFQSALGPDLAHGEKLEHLAETFGHIRPDLLGALGQHPMLSGFVSGSLGNGSGPDLGFMQRGDLEGASWQERQSWAGQDTWAGTLALGTLDFLRNGFDGEENSEGAQLAALIPGAQFVGYAALVGHAIDSMNSPLPGLDNTLVPNPPARNPDGGGDGTEVEPSTPAEPADGTNPPDDPEAESQPAPDQPWIGPGGPGGVFDPEGATDPRLNPHAPTEGALTEFFAELEASQRENALSWQEQLVLDELIVTNPGLPVVAALQTDTFVFSTPEIGPEGQSGQDPEPIGPGLMYDASAAAPALGTGHAAQVVGDFPVDTIDPDDGLIGEPMFADLFLI